MRLAALLVAAVSAAILAAGCAKFKNPTKDWTPERFYNEAQVAMEKEDYERAIKLFETMEARYPYGRYSQQAQLEIAYVYFKADQPELAKEAAERFIRLHPTHPHVAYAYYLKGLINIGKEATGIARWLNLRGAEAKRDPSVTKQAYDAFEEVVERFPDSTYAQDSARRMAYLRNTLAKHEVRVAQFYLNQDAYVAAVNRTKYVLENYGRTPAVEDALAIQAKAYKLMGLTDLMDDTVRVLKMNFPNSDHLKDINAPESEKKKGKKRKKKKKKQKTEGPIVSY